jgi:DNA-binding PadR family transcriptional regulator
MSDMLKPAAFYLLLGLADEDRHGYGVMQAVRERSGGRVTLGTASFYRHLARLIEAGLVAESPDRPERADPRRGAYYRLTDRGRETLAAECLRLQDQLAAAQSWAGSARGHER